MKMNMKISEAIRSTDMTPIRTIVFSGLNKTDKTDTAFRNVRQKTDIFTCLGETKLMRGSDRKSDAAVMSGDVRQSKLPTAAWERFGNNTYFQTVR